LLQRRHLEYAHCPPLKRRSNSRKSTMSSMLKPHSIRRKWTSH